MWDRLSVPVEYRARFVEKHPTLTQVIFTLLSRHRPLSLCLSQEVLDAYEDEVRRQRHHIKGRLPLTLCPLYSNNTMCPLYLNNTLCPLFFKNTLCLITLQWPSMLHAPASRRRGGS